jgi:hypothetical protein
MSRYFSYFPQRLYSLDSGETYQIITDILKRVKFDDTIKNESVLYYTYSIQDGERPEILAHKIYGDEEKHWMILLLNDIVDIKEQWPLSYKELNDHIISTYGSIATAQSTVHAYYKTLTYKILNSDDTVRVEKTQITSTQYAAVVEGTETLVLNDGTRYTLQTQKTQQSKYDYEIALNDSKREIKVLKKQYVNNVMKNFQDLINV